jgi:hypothetical protein
MALSVAAQRTIRSFVHYAVAALTAIPILVPEAVRITQGTPVGDKLAVFAGALVVWSTAIAGLLNKLEAKYPNRVPGFLKNELPSVFSETPGVPVPPAMQKLEDLIDKLPPEETP